MIADTSYLADIAQNVAGHRITIDSLLPLGDNASSCLDTMRWKVSRIPEALR